MPLAAEHRQSGPCETTPLTSSGAGIRDAALSLPFHILS